MKKLALIITVFIICPQALEASRVPRVTVIMVIDQFAHHYIQRLKPHFKHGLRHLLHHGIVYENAYHPHSMPCTATGHTGLNTGTYAKDHGIISNKWYDRSGKLVYADDDPRPESAVLGTEWDGQGKSARNILVDGLSDQFMLNQDACTPRNAYAISIKSRSSIMCAGKLGKAIWFDNDTGNFTSSKAYFDHLPDWIEQFNTDAEFKKKNNVRWNLCFKENSPAYCYANLKSYHHCSRPDGLAGHTMALSSIPDKKPYELFLRTPSANWTLFQLAEECIAQHVHYHGNEELLLWLCLSPLDIVGHEYGPQSLETIDMIYHLDRQIECFMKNVTKCLKRRDFLFVVTADHGVAPIPEVMNDNKFKASQRVNYETIIDDINKLVEKKFGITRFIHHFQSNQFYVDQKQVHALPPDQQRTLLKQIKNYLQNHGLVKAVWTDAELMRTHFDDHSIESYFKHQFYPGRSGSLIVQPLPYNPFICYPKGATHRTPYECDTHVPLILYQKSYLEKRVVFEKVWTLQLANTLAYLLHIPKPSASTMPILPGIIDYDPITGEAIQPMPL